MLRTILIHGSIAGLIVGSILAISTVLLPDDTSVPVRMAVGYASMLLALSAIFVGVKKHRDVARGGVIGFWPAFGMGLTISFVASLFYIAAWEATLGLTGMDFVGDYTRLLVDEARAAGGGAAEIAKIEADMSQFAADYANPLYRLPMTFTEIFPVGVLVSLVSAALLRNSRFLPARA